MRLAKEREAFNKLQMIISLRIMVGPLFIYALLESIKQSKRIFAAELELGREAPIPDGLGQKHLP